MPSTPTYNWPIPAATDFVKDGWEAISDLGNAIDTTLDGIPVSPFTVIASATVSAQSAINLSSVLTNTYKFYELRLYGQISSSSVLISGRFRENTTDKATGYSNMIPAVLTNATVGNWDGGTNKTAFLFGRSGTAQLFLRATIFRNSATEGLISFQSNDPSTPQHIFGESFNTSMTNFNGISLFPASGTFTGSYTLIGYN
jgi:hypothetical protein